MPICKLRGKHVNQHCGKCFKKQIRKQIGKYPSLTKHDALHLVLDQKGKRR